MGILQNPEDEENEEAEDESEEESEAEESMVSWTVLVHVLGVERERYYTNHVGLASEVLYFPRLLVF